MARLEFGLENFSINSAMFYEIEKTSIALEEAISDVEFREIKNDDKKDDGKKSFIMDKINKIIAWFKEKMKKIGDFIKNFYYKNRYLLNNRFMSINELTAQARQIAYKLIHDQGKVELAEKIKTVSNKQYIKYVLTDMSGTLQGNNRLSEFRSFGRLVDILKVSGNDIKKCWNEVKSNNQDVTKYLDNIEKQNDEFERISKTSEKSSITPEIFTKMLDDMSQHRLTDIMETINFCNALNKESDKVLSEYTGDVNRITRVMAQYTANYTKLIYCTDVQSTVTTSYFGINGDEWTDNKLAHHFINCYKENNN